MGSSYYQSATPTAFSRADEKIGSRSSTAQKPIFHNSDRGSQDGLKSSYISFVDVQRQLKLSLRNPVSEALYIISH